MVAVISSPFGLDAISVTFCGFRRQTSADINPIFILPLSSFRYKDKSVPLQAWSGPEGSRKLRFPDFITTAQDGGKVLSLTHRPPLP